MITTHIIADGAGAASRWYQDVFGAVERSHVCDVDLAEMTALAAIVFGPSEPTR